MEKINTPLMQLIESDEKKLKTLKGVYETRKNNAFLEGQILTLEAGIKEKRSLLPDERDIIIDFARPSNADGHDLEKAFIKTFKSYEQ